MRTLLALLAAAALTGAAVGDELGGFRCENQCPLAQAANQRRALGDEALATSTVVRTELAARVAADLARI